MKKLRRRRRLSRPYLIDIEDFETVEDIEMEDWMFGSSGKRDSVLEKRNDGRRI